MKKVIFLLLLILIFIDIIGFTIFTNLISQKSDTSVAAAIVMSFGFFLGNCMFFSYLGKIFKNVKKN